MAHSISKKQAGVIYSAWKRGEIRAEREVISKIYDYAEYFVSTDSNDEQLTAFLRSAVDAIFAHDTEKAQAEIDGFVAYRKLVYC